MPLSTHTHPLQPAVSVWMLINFSEISTGLLIVSFPLPRSAPLSFAPFPVPALWLLFRLIGFCLISFLLISYPSCLSFPLVHPLMSSILLYFLLCLLSFSRFHGLQLLPCPLLIFYSFHFTPSSHFLLTTIPGPTLPLSSLVSPHQCICFLCRLVFPLLWTCIQRQVKEDVIFHLSHTLSFLAVAYRCNHSVDRRSRWE